MEEQSDSSGTVSYRGSPLYDQVRIRFLTRFELALDSYVLGLEELSFGKIPKNVNVFVSRVIATYIEVKPKLTYANTENKTDSEDYKIINKVSEILKELDDYLLTGIYLQRDEDLPVNFNYVNDASQRKILWLFLQYSKYLIALRDFFEINGITKYEFAKYDETDQLVRAMAYG
jgi:hypothetical protein